MKFPPALWRGGNLSISFDDPGVPWVIPGASQNRTSSFFTRWLQRAEFDPRNPARWTLFATCRRGICKIFESNKATFEINFLRYVKNKNVWKELSFAAKFNSQTSRNQTQTRCKRLVFSDRCLCLALEIITRRVEVQKRKTSRDEN